MLIKKKELYKIIFFLFDSNKKNITIFATLPHAKIKNVFKKAISHFVCLKVIRLPGKHLITVALDDRFAVISARQ